MSTNLNIVVVEDNDLLREEMVSFLTRPGWQAHGVGSGEDLNSWLKQDTPRLAVLDEKLPHEDGYSIARPLARYRHRDDDRTRELTAVVENLSRRLPMAV